MGESPIGPFCAAIDSLDADAVMALIAPGGELVLVDGSRAQGTDAVRQLLSDFFKLLRSTTHHVSAEWHDGDVWIAEIAATYERADGMRTGELARAMVLHEQADGIAAVRVYGMQPPLLADPPGQEEGLRLGGRWIPPL
jgi:ketosteroid isomerase-like protein